jgi:hypothetical protein
LLSRLKRRHGHWESCKQGRDTKRLECQREENWGADKQLGQEEGRLVNVLEEDLLGKLFRKYVCSLTMKAENKETGQRTGLQASGKTPRCEAVVVTDTGKGVGMRPN